MVVVIHCEAGMFPARTLANYSMFSDLLAKLSPTKPQGTVWVEIWKTEAIDTAALPTCGSPADLTDVLIQWDKQLRTELRASLE